MDILEETVLEMIGDEISFDNLKSQSVTSNAGGENGRH